MTQNKTPIEALENLHERFLFEDERQAGIDYRTIRKTLDAMQTDKIAVDVEDFHSMIDMDIEDERGAQLSFNESRFVGIVLRKLQERNLLHAQGRITTQRELDAKWMMETLDNAIAHGCQKNLKEAANAVRQHIQSGGNVKKPLDADLNERA